jgi:hypothetical protein
MKKILLITILIFTLTSCFNDKTVKEENNIQKETTNIVDEKKEVKDETIKETKDETTQKTKKENEKEEDTKIKDKLKEIIDE